MGYELQAMVHAWLLRLRREEGQGTVEYVGLILLLAVVLAGVVKASGSFSDQSIVKTIVAKLKAAMGSVKPG